MIKLVILQGNLVAHIVSIWYELYSNTATISSIVSQVNQNHTGLENIINKNSTVEYCSVAFIRSGTNLNVSLMFLESQYMAWKAAPQESTSQ